MKIRIIALAATLLMLSTTCAHAVEKIQQKSAAKSCIHLHYIVNRGFMEMFVCEDGARIECDKDLVLLTDASLQSVLFFNKRTLASVKVSSDVITKEFRKNSEPYDFRKLPSLNVVDWPQLHVVRKSLPKATLNVNSLTGFLIGTDDTVKTRAIELFEADPLAVEDAVSKNVSSAQKKKLVSWLQNFFIARYGLQANSIPVGGRVIMPNGEGLWVFRETAMTRETASKEMFTPPKNLQLARSVEDVVFDKRQQSEMLEMCEQLDLGEPFGGRRTQAKPQASPSTKPQAKPVDRNGQQK